MKTAAVMIGLVLMCASLFAAEPDNATSREQSARRAYAGYLGDLAKTLAKVRQPGKLFELAVAAEKRMKGFAKTLGYELVPFETAPADEETGRFAVLTLHWPSSIPQKNYGIVFTPELAYPASWTARRADIVDCLKRWQTRVLADPKK